MQKKISVKSAEQTEHALVFCAEHTDLQTEELKPRHHMLVDSDNLAFLYILEGDGDYMYVSIPHTVWPACKQMLDEHKKAYVRVNETELELEQLQEELEYLISNIEGNANYGEELVSKVEAIFLA
ncbi:hypothetical protein [Ectobacillus panaciterrae]|uniref:UPF0738 family protein n=1 Tax=Ectobacillus panaciterrae TaxID=363872 RepID=UPI00041A0811|nr:hypothetical protein [Ectobacillus panaciterrae]